VPIKSKRFKHKENYFFTEDIKLILREKFKKYKELQKAIKSKSEKWCKLWHNSKN